MELKQYQSDTLSTLRRFLEEARIVGPENAYKKITNESEQSGRVGSYAGTYLQLDELPDTPYVCLRLPTGGGKTILAAHSVMIARDAWVEKDWPMVLWLVPTNTIRLQTVEALKNTKHPYRKVLDEAFDGRVRIFNIADFVDIQPHDLRDHCCIVVGTIQTLRVQSTVGRKVYAHNENMEPHFTKLSGSSSGLEILENGDIKFSFANLMHIHRPLMIVDEAHNAVTGLTREMQTRVNPCAIIEFTATPRLNSNILYSVTAQALKQEEMIKLPIMLSEHDSWYNAVNDAVAVRASLAETAKEDSGYIRPIVLFQAQRSNQDVTVGVLKQHLIEVECIPEEKIAVATGNQRELDKIELFDPECPIEHVITIEALKEGWDCSFAYIFCSVSRIHSAEYVEQLLGRVLRMPYAKRRKDNALNKAYAFVSEPDFGKAARTLVDKLVAMGFDEEEARANIGLAQKSLDGGGSLFEHLNEREPIFRHIIKVKPEAISALEKNGSISVHKIEGGETEIVIAGHITEALEKTIEGILPVSQQESFTNAVVKHRDELLRVMSPARRGETFRIPCLMSEIQGALKFADVDIFMEYHDWSLLNHSSVLGEDEFTIRETAHSYEIDLDGSRITYQRTTEDQHLALDIHVEGWTPESLVLWLDKEVRQADVRQGELLRWLSDLVSHLITTRRMHIAALMRCKFILARKIRERIADIRQKERNNVYQRYLFAPEARVTVSFDQVFDFGEDMYGDRRCYQGHWKPSKHFLGPNHVPVFDGAEEGEEFRCAQVIDSLPNVKFWLRNVAKDSRSFWLPTATSKFYPDFVARLKDGRLLVVEYKGDHIVSTQDTAEKRIIGELWEQNSTGKGLFIVAEKVVNGKDVRQQLMQKIGTV